MLETILVESIATLKNRVEGQNKWANARYRCIKDAPPTIKSDFGQDSTARMITEICGLNSEVVNGGKGDFDILVHGVGEFEHKLATEDANGSFQFNGIDCAKEWDWVFCLAVAPNHVMFGIYSHEECEDRLTTNMTKAGGGKKLITNPRTQPWPLFDLTEANLKQEIARCQAHGMD